MTDCPNCEYHRQRAQRWREEAYKLSGYPLPERDGVKLNQGQDYERGFIEGMQYQTQKVIEAKLKEKNT
jgi:hypothetical protein